jgi:hypothetical protein
VTQSYADLWKSSFSPAWRDDAFVAVSDIDPCALGDVDQIWSETVPLRRDYERWLAATEIDAIVALLLGLSARQLIQLYRSQFGVLRKYESRMVFDGKGRQIAGDHQAYGVKQAKWETARKERRTRRDDQGNTIWDRVQAYQLGDPSVDLAPFEPPFHPANREDAMERAYSAFAARYGLEALDR